MSTRRDPLESAVTDSGGCAVSAEVVAYLVHWNAPVWCARTVGALQRSTGVAVDVTVINNGGQLDLPETVKVVTAPRNLGFTGAANLALSSPRPPGRYVLVGNHDFVLEPSSLRDMVGALEADRGIGIVGPSFVDAPSADVEWLPGSCMVMRPEIADRYRFDERYGSYVEDVDLCYRVRDDGWRLRRSAARASQTGSVDESAAMVLMHANTVAFFVSRGMWRSAARRSMWLAAETLRGLSHGDGARARSSAQALAMAVWRSLRFRLGRPTAATP